jgi:hypothetical protein
LIKVVDGNKKPLPNATVRMMSIRIAEAPGDGIGWPELPGEPKEFSTDKEGIARLRYPLKTNNHSHLTKVGFSVSAAHHVPLAHHQIPLNLPSPPEIQLDAAASLRVYARCGPAGPLAPWCSQGLQANSANTGFVF